MDEFDYKKYLNLIIKRKYLFVVIALAIMTGVAIIGYLLPKRYEAKSTVFIEKSFLNDVVKGIAITPGYEDRLRGLAYAIKSRALLLKVFNDLGLDVSKQNNGQLEAMVREFQKDTDVRMKDQEGLFTVSFTHQDPRIALNYVNALVRRYIDENVSSKREESSSASKFLAGQIAAMKAKLDESEARANAFKRDNGGVLGQSEAELLREISDAQQRIAEISQKRRQLENQFSLVRKDDPLKARLAALQRKKQELALVYTDIHPEVMEINNQITSIKEQPQSARAGVDAAPSVEQETIRMELNAQRETEAGLRRLIASRYSMLRSLPSAKSGLDELERERNGQKSLYDQLVARYEQSEVSKQVEAQEKTAIFRIVDPAVMPAAPISPQRVKIMLLGILGGFAGSFALLVLLDRIDSSVRSSDSLKSLGIQILAVVPNIENPLEQMKLRKKDFWFFSLAGTYFLLILAIIPIELFRGMHIEIFDASNIKQNLSLLKNISFK